jgi:hypothetical protein
MPHRRRLDLEVLRKGVVLSGEVRPFPRDYRSQNLLYSLKNRNLICCRTGGVPAGAKSPRSPLVLNENARRESAGPPTGVLGNESAQLASPKPTARKVPRVYCILMRVRSYLGMFTSAEFPITHSAVAGAGAQALSARDFAQEPRRVSHRVALTIIVGGSVGCYALLYVASSWVLKLVVGA